MESNDSTVQNADERLIVVGVDGSACATPAVEFAAKQAAPRLRPARHGPPALRSPNHQRRLCSIGSRSIAVIEAQPT